MSIRATNAKQNDPYYLAFVRFITEDGDYYDTDYHDGMYYRKRAFYVNLLDSKSKDIDYGIYKLFPDETESELEYHIDTLFG